MGPRMKYISNAQLSSLKKEQPYKIFFLKFNFLSDQVFIQLYYQLGFFPPLTPFKDI